MSREQYDDLIIDHKHKRRQNSKLPTVIAIIVFLIIGFSIFFFVTGDEKPSSNEAKVEENLKTEYSKTENSKTPSPNIKKEVVINETAVAKDIANSPEVDIISFTPYIVKEGDTLASISYKNNISRDTILAVNKLINSSKMKVGQVITLPSVNGIIYIVKKDDTLDNLVSTFAPQLTLSQYLKAVNRSNSTIISGEELFFPSPIQTKPKFETVNLLKPNNGEIVTMFGQVKNGIPSRGMEFIQTDDLFVNCALSGVVKDITFSPEKGKCVIVTSDNYEITYGNLRRIEVSINSIVEKGERIGSFGNFDASEKAKLYFEVKVDGISINPEQLF